MRKSLVTIFAAAEPRSNVESVRQLGREASHAGADAIVLLGSLKSRGADPRSYGELLKALAEAHLPSFFIPGPDDFPFTDFLQEAANFEVVYPQLHSVHGTFAMAPGYNLFAGLGGLIEDDPNSVREEVHGLRYPGWEVAYRLKFLRELKDYERILLFTTTPEHKRLSEHGSEKVAEMIKTHKPRVALVGGPNQKNETLGTSPVVTLGSLDEGQFTVINMRKREVTHHHLGETVTTAA